LLCQPGTLIRWQKEYGDFRMDQSKHLTQEDGA